MSQPKREYMKSMKMEDEIRYWAAQRKVALMITVILDKITAIEVARTFILKPTEIKAKVD